MAGCGTEGRADCSSLFVVVVSFVWHCDFLGLGLLVARELTPLQSDIRPWSIIGVSTFYM